MSAGPVTTIPLSPEIVTSGTATSPIHTLVIKQNGTVVTIIKQSIDPDASVKIVFNVPIGHNLGLEVAGTTTPRTNPFTAGVGEHDTDVTLTSTTTTAAARGTLKVKIEAKTGIDEAMPKLEEM